ncbi:hypothetical protein [Hydrogenophaga sp. BPS33]|nr:hypothetical protein [Hydrogenophaga sp. BPS33]
MALEDVDDGCPAERSQIITTDERLGISASGTAGLVRAVPESMHDGA